MDEFLRSDDIFLTDSADIQDYISEFKDADDSDLEKALRLYLKIRDGIRYDPFNINLEFGKYSVENIISEKRGHCVDKAVLFITCCRALRIPSRLGLSKVKNHIGTSKLEALLKTNALVPHGYAEAFVSGKWSKCTPAFNKELCDRLNVPPLEWNGRDDSVFQSFSQSDNQFMEYIEDYGTYSEMPTELIVDLMKKEYPHMFKGDSWVWSEEE